ncbi:MAG TPA: helix-turn-helix domain-containing protein [Bryobacteraceae bacterium]|nr:helix-turn-helix domain-containing protein [Bryobacteraceae bacterium]
MQYPTGFPEHLKRPIDTAIAKAEAVFTASALHTQASDRNIEQEILRYIESVFFAFCSQVLQAVIEGIWNGETARSHTQIFLQTLTRNSFYEMNHPAIGSLQEMARFEWKATQHMKGDPMWLDHQTKMADALSRKIQLPTVPESGQRKSEGLQKRALPEPKPELLGNPDATLSRLRAAEALGITPRTLDRWIADGKLTPVGIGARKRFKTKDLKRVLDQRTLDKRDTK